MTDRFDSLSDELVLLIFVRIAAVRTRLRLLRVSTRFRRLALDQTLWSDFPLGPRHAWGLCLAADHHAASQNIPLPPHGQRPPFLSLDLTLTAGEEEMAEGVDAERARRIARSTQDLVVESPLGMRLNYDVIAPLFDDLEGSAVLRSITLLGDMFRRYDHYGREDDYAAHTDALNRVPGWPALTGFKLDMMLWPEATTELLRALPPRMRAIQLGEMVINADDIDLSASFPELEVFDIGEVETGACGGLGLAGHPRLRTLRSLQAPEQALLFRQQRAATKKKGNAAAPTATAPPLNLVELECCSNGSDPLRLTYPSLTRLTVHAAGSTPPITAAQVPALVSLVIHGTGRAAAPSVIPFPHLFDALPSLREMTFAREHADALLGKETMANLKRAVRDDEDAEWAFQVGERALRVKGNAGRTTVLRA